ncbi:putative DEAD/DEAH box helicase-like [Candidatus Competibacter denitrificans Run_A_D11]|uniref:DEAD/DEAH box helicase-like n=1 Tax=Candidatus Competibacter denitrificans Run_A_D11 TaxID=1400863 RepID=W6M9N5_9GAMM|nr:DEAD/DEAH box helicase [Candidatus Competibacter denitrificans]CDI02485.1 putative DEAD/DEAH box helicase-like [Candidatus Competibacter denitrificans Run_A_D11]HAS86477.1 ATP-dependent helicase [Candidatus Competibacteraceae bacterium]HRC70478.1 DEAD/DEAH box helicase [Candidatus Competibacter denitrificans]
MSGLSLFKHQEALMSAVKQSYLSGSQAVLMILPTGGGKTAIAAKIAQLAHAKGKRILFLAHRRELILQISRMLTVFGIGHGVILPDTFETKHSVQVASIATLARRLYPGKYQFDLIIIDEAHHAVNGSGLGAIIEAFPKAKLLGVTATPCRLDGRGLGKDAAGYFDALVEGPSVLELIEAGYLARPVVYAPPAGQEVDLRSVKVTAGDYNLGQLASVMDKALLTGDAVAHYRRHCDGAPALAFCVTVEHAEHVARQFREAGYRAAMLDGKTPDDRRDAMIRDLGRGELQVLASCNVVSEGTDIPIVAAAILLRPTASYALAMQQMGRVLRTYPGKQRATILDHAGNTRRHGLPTEPGQWSLANRPRNKSATNLHLTKDCVDCGALLPLAARTCPECSCVFEWARTTEEPPPTVAGELEAIDAVAVARERRREVARARSLEELQAIGRARGYKSGWAWHIWRERQQGAVTGQVAYG